MLDISSEGETLKVHGAIDNTLETYWEIGEPKIPLERVKDWHFLVCVLAHLIGCQEFLSLLVFVTIFGLG
jgi:hypothetical protein